MLSLFFSFHGRINRLQYWLGNLVAGLFGALAFALVAVIAAPDDGAHIDPLFQILKTLAFAAPAMLALMWVGFALQAKRFHDRGRSGYFALAPLAPWIIMGVGVVSGLLANKPASIILVEQAPWLWIVNLIAAYFVFELGSLPGVKGPNRFGAPPSGGLTPGAPPITTGPEKPAPQKASALAGAEAAMELAISGAAKPSPAASDGFARPASTNAPSFGKRPAN